MPCLPTLRRPAPANLSAAILVVSLAGTAAPGTAAPPKAAVPLPDPATPSAAADPDAVDIAPLRADLKVLHDGHGHYLALVPFGPTSVPAFYSADGKVFHAQRLQGGGSSGTESFDRTFWDPRHPSGWQRSIGFRDAKYHVQCGERATEFQPVAAAERERLLTTAAFRTHAWKRRAYALARDLKGRYFYVDTGNVPKFAKAFQLWAGPRGDMKKLPMQNVVSDSGGDIFATKTGTLRLVLDRTESLWVANGKEEKLIVLPVEDNGALIYSDLGPYLGLRLGTACDDL